MFYLKRQKVKANKLKFQPLIDCLKANNLKIAELINYLAKKKELEDIENDEIKCKELKCEKINTTVAKDVNKQK